MKKTLLLISLIFLVGCASKSELESALSEISVLESQISQKDLNIVDLEDQTQSLIDSLNNLQNDFDELNEEHDTLLEEFSNKKHDLQKVQNQLSKHICYQQIDDMKYENIFDVSTILAGWWVKQPGVQSVQGTYRDHIWNNTDTKIHSVMFTSSDDNQPYVEHFLVFFDEFGWKEGIFWLSSQCWLDSPF